MRGWVYILECADGTYYTGSTNNIDLRIAQHQNGEGANHTKKRLPVKSIYSEEFQRIDEAFYREKQVQGWSRKKKEALINSDYNKLPDLAKNYTQYPRDVVSTGSTTETTNETTKSTPLPEPVEGNSIDETNLNQPFCCSYLVIIPLTTNIYCIIRLKQLIRISLTT